MRTSGVTRAARRRFLAWRRRPGNFVVGCHNGPSTCHERDGIEAAGSNNVRLGRRLGGKTWSGTQDRTALVVSAFFDSGVLVGLTYVTFRPDTRCSAVSALYIASPTDGAKPPSCCQFPNHVVVMTAQTCPWFCGSVLTEHCHLPRISR